MKKRVFCTELAYVLGLLFLATGVVFMERADFGVSMVVAPAYILYRWLNPIWSFFSFGTAEYCLQAVLLIVMLIVLRKFRWSYLFSFVTAVIYGFVLDALMLLGVYLNVDSIVLRVLWYIIGMVLGSIGVSFMFHTYISPEVYELFVKEISTEYKKNINVFKTCYDCASTLVGIIMSFCAFGMWRFVGVSWGTIVCSVVNGFLIGRFSKFLTKKFTFADILPFRRFFIGQRK